MSLREVTNLTAKIHMADQSKAKEGKVHVKRKE